MSSNRRLASWADIVSIKKFLDKQQFFEAKELSDQIFFIKFIPESCYVEKEVWINSYDLKKFIIDDSINNTINPFKHF